MVTKPGAAAEEESKKVLAVRRLGDVIYGFVGGVWYPLKVQPNGQVMVAFPAADITLQMQLGLPTKEELEARKKKTVAALVQELTPLAPGAPPVAPTPPPFQGTLTQRLAESPNVRLHRVVGRHIAQGVRNRITRIRTALRPENIVRGVTRSKFLGVLTARAIGASAERIRMAAGLEPLAPIEEKQTKATKLLGGAGGTDSNMAILNALESIAKNTAETNTTLAKMLAFAVGSDRTNRVHGLIFQRKESANKYVEESKNRFSLKDKLGSAASGVKIGIGTMLEFIGIQAIARAAGALILGALTSPITLGVVATIATALLLKNAQEQAMENFKRQQSGEAPDYVDPMSGVPYYNRKPGEPQTQESASSDAPGFDKLPKDKKEAEARAAGKAPDVEPPKPEEPPDTRNWWERLIGKPRPRVEQKLPRAPGGDTGKSGSTAVPHPPGNAMSGTELRDFFVDKGYSPKIASAIVGNLAQESSLDPTKVNPKSGAFGLAQWLDRKPALIQFAKSKNLDVNDSRTQAEFIDYELKGKESKALSAMKNAEAKGASLEELSNIFALKYERMGLAEARFDKRQQYSRAVLGDSDAGKITPSSSQTGTILEKQADSVDAAKTAATGGGGQPTVVATNITNNNVNAGGGNQGAPSQIGNVRNDEDTHTLMWYQDTPGRRMMG